MKNNILFLDIETIPAGERLPPEAIPVPGNISKQETIDKFKKEKAPALVEKEYRDRAKKPHKCKILCLSVAFNEDETKVYYDEDEKKILEQFQEDFKAYEGMAVSFNWCGFNIIHFDIPIIWQRVAKYDLDFLRRYMPLKRYSPRIIDLMEYFYAPNYREMVSFKEVCGFFGIKAKNELNGSKVYDYYLKGKIKEICQYCKEDNEGNREIYNKMGLDKII